MMDSYVIYGCSPFTRASFD